MFVACWYSHRHDNVGRVVDGGGRVGVLDGEKRGELDGSGHLTNHHFKGSLGESEMRRGRRKGGEKERGGEREENAELNNHSEHRGGVETHWAGWVEVVQVLLEDDGDILTRSGEGGGEVSNHAEK